MHIHLVHNPKAGLGAHEKQQLLENLTAAGHRVTSLASEESSPGSHCNMMAVAGGDGTIEKVVRRFYKSEPSTTVPLMIIPLGTANNIARSLGIPDGLDAFSAAWKHGGRRPGSAQKKLSVGRLSGPNYERLFVESVGCGILTQLIGGGTWSHDARQSDAADQQALLHRHLDVLPSLMPCVEASYYSLLIDGRDYSGHYLLVEIMNIAYVGPGLELAPGKDPGAAKLQVVLIEPNEEERFSDYLSAVDRGHNVACPFAGIPGRKVTLTCRASKMHVDDKVLKGDNETRYTIEAGVRRIFIAN